MFYIHWAFILAYVFIIVSIMLAVLMDNRQPAKTIAWVMVLLFMPIVGIVLYVFFGRNTRKMTFISQRSLDQLSKRSMLEFVEQRQLTLPDDYRSLIQLFTNQSLALPFKDNEVEFYTDGYEFFPALLKSIASARKHIHLETYIFADDALGRLVADALICKSREGVEVRLIYDDVGCWRVPRELFERMRRAGVDVNAFMPVKFPAFTSKVNYRNHRKVCVVDGVEARHPSPYTWWSGVRPAAHVPRRLVFRRPHTRHQLKILSADAVAHREQLPGAGRDEQSDCQMAGHHAGICAHTA